MHGLTADEGADEEADEVHRGLAKGTEVLGRCPPFQVVLVKGAKVLGVATVALLSVPGRGR